MICFLSIRKSLSLLVKMALGYSVTLIPVAAEVISCPTTQEIHNGKTRCVIEKQFETAKTDIKRKPNAPATLRDVIAIAIDRHPQIVAARYRVREALAGIDVAKSNGKFQLEGYYGVGFGSMAQSLAPLESSILDRDNLTNQIRNELTLSGRQLIYDFGATESGVMRAVKLKSSEDYNLAAKIEDIALNVSDAYMRVVESRELSRLNKDNIEALQKIQELVVANQKNGNGTVADVKRVEARLVDAKSVAADTEAELQNAVDRFRRLVKEEPGNLMPTPVLTSFIPKSPSLAIGILPRSSVHLLSIDAAIRGLELELKAKRQGNMPQLVMQMDAISKFYSGRTNKNEIEARAMLNLSYKFIDGGLSDAQLAQIAARLGQEQQRYDFDRDEAEADLRQFFNAIEAARGKSRSLAEGVDASAKARELYTEQFRGGKRTLFELLDIQTAYFSASRNQIMNFFEEQRSVYSVLKTLGIFTQVALNAKSDVYKEEFVTNSIGTHTPFPEPLVEWGAPLHSRDQDR